MKRQYLLLVFTLVSLLLGCKNIEEMPKSEKLTKRVVAIGLDGISVDGYLKAKHPNLDALMAEGVLSLTTRNVMPSVTLPNWTSHLTGSGPEQHGVLSNGWELDKIVLPAIDTDGQGYYPSIFKVLKENVPNVKTAFYYNWAELINSFNKTYMDELSFEGNDEYQKNYSISQLNTEYV